MERLIEDEQSRIRLVAHIGEQKLPFRVKITDGRDRSLDQNRLQFLWMKEIAEHFGDCTPAEVRAYCKLTFGIEILCNDDEEYREIWERLTRKLSYQDKLALMRHYEVTSLMTTKQMTQYLDEIGRHFAEQGVTLTQPGPPLAEQAA